MGELVVGEGMGSGGPRSLGGHGDDQPRVLGPLAASTQSGGDHSHRFWGWSLHKATLQSLLRSVIKLGKLGRLDLVKNE